MIQEKVTDVVAVAGIASPFWLPALQDASSLAALLLPIFGVIWLLVQIIGYMKKKKD